MNKKLGFKYCLLMTMILLTTGVMLSITGCMQNEDKIEIYQVPISYSPTAINIVEKDVYAGNVEYVYSHRIEYTLTNTSDAYYGFGQIDRAFKLVDSAWFEIDGYVAIQDLLRFVSPNSSIDMGFNLRFFDSFSDITPPGGVYLFKKPLFSSVLCEQSYRGWDFDVLNPSWLHIIVEIP